MELALLLAAQPDLMLPDEPTNHLSLQLVQDLEQPLAKTPATVIIASHNRWMPGRWNSVRLHLGDAAR